MSNQLIMPRPDDWHVHLRAGDAMRAVVRYTAAHFGRALVMPNLNPPIRTVKEALSYRAEIVQAAKALGAERFEPVMTLYLTEETPFEEIRRAAAEPYVRACKLYPAHATTHADWGVRDIKRIYPILECMQKHRLVLAIHGEVTEPDVDIFDREARFIDQVLAPLVRTFPELKIVLEHITTAEAVAFVREAPEQVAATITAHHLVYNRNALFAGGLRPHHFCLPVPKRERHRQALVEAAISGNPKFFLGTDSAPHARSRKESSCGCAGAFTAPVALALYAQVFAECGALERLADFAACFGAAFYGFPVASEKVRLVARRWQVPESYPFLPGDPVIPLCAGETLFWQLEELADASG